MHALPWIIVGFLAPLTLGSGAFARPFVPVALVLVIAFPCAIPRQFRCLSLGLMAAAWSFLTITMELERRVDEGFEAALVGEVVSLPVLRFDGVSFVLQVSEGPWGKSSRRLEVFWPRANVIPIPGDYWRFPLKVRAARGRVNFTGVDRERHWFAHRVHGLATVREDGERISGTHTYSLHGWRYRVLEKLKTRIGNQPGGGLVQALGLGDRQALSKELRTAMMRTGTGHLLAISGLHVGMVGWFAFLTCRIILALFQWRARRWPPQRAALLMSMGCAMLYALLAGFGTSPRRALIMLCAVCAVWLMRRRLGPWRSWGVALMLVLGSNPLAPLQAGFWLSFGAVAVLLVQFSGKSPRPRGLAAMTQAQAVIALALVPLGMLWFQYAGLAAPWINLLAIPWVSFITLPLVLLTLLSLPFDGPAGEIVAHMACHSAWLLERALIWVAGGRVGSASANWLGIDVGAPGMTSLILGVAGGLLLLAPKTLAVRRFAFAMWLPLFAPEGVKSKAGELTLELLDVGQGQATVIRTQHHALLVDVGPGMPEQWSLAPSVIVPALRTTGHNRPDLVLVSHGDLDHSGGLRDLMAAWPGVAFMGNLRKPLDGVNPCHDGRRWEWDGVAFRVLHPTPWLPYRGNDSSCVLSVVSTAGSVLLPGDISSLVERRLLLNSRPLHHDILLAAHHGSRSSSAASFIDGVAPNLVLISAGFGNRFGFPHEGVISRFQERGLLALSTAQCGALRYQFKADGNRIASSARHVRGGFWRWPAHPDCPMKNISGIGDS